MNEFPKLTKLNGGKMWEHYFEQFIARVYIPDSDLPTEVINYGFMTPYLLVFEQTKNTFEETKEFADLRGLSDIAKEYGGSVVFIYPRTEKGWADAPRDLFAQVIEKTKIGQYYKDGALIDRNRFTGEWGKVFIRGALHRSCVFGVGEAADFIAETCFRTIEGTGLYGKGDITPALCVLEKLQKAPVCERADLAVLSVKNSKEINEALRNQLPELMVTDENVYSGERATFIKKYRRMVGNLEKEPDLAAMGIMVQPGFCVVKVSPDNQGDDCDKPEHTLGYVAYVQEKGISSGEKLPLVLCFHGGGDSAMCMVSLSEWYEVVAKNDFLLISVEHHMNSTATEVMELLEHLKSRFPIDEQRIYATGFSMGGCKTWDLFQEYPLVFAGVAPMDATFEVGTNVFANPAPRVNQDVTVPVFYVGGEDSPLPELPCQAQKCADRMQYVLKVNNAVKQYEADYEKRDTWQNKIMGMDGDMICIAKDNTKEITLTMHLFESKDKNCYSVFASASNQKHEMRRINCINAWNFLSRFRRLEDGTLTGATMEELSGAWQDC